MAEEWKNIPGYEGIYEASTLGRIRTVVNKTTFSKRSGKRVWKQRVLKPKVHRRKNTQKYDARVNLWKDGTNKTFLVSRLVALTWVPNYEDGMTVNHIDGNPLNNCVANLEWISLADNIRHGFDHGLYTSCIKCKLTDESGNEYILNSLNQASRFLQWNDGYLRNIKSKVGLDKPVRARDGTFYTVTLS